MCGDAVEERLFLRYPARRVEQIRSLDCSFHQPPHSVSQVVHSGLALLRVIQRFIRLLRRPFSEGKIIWYMDASNAGPWEYEVMRMKAVLIRVIA